MGINILLGCYLQEKVPKYYFVIKHINIKYITYIKKDNIPSLINIMQQISIFQRLLILYKQKATLYI